MYFRTGINAMETGVVFNENKHIIYIETVDF